MTYEFQTIACGDLETAWIDKCKKVPSKQVGYYSQSHKQPEGPKTFIIAYLFMEQIIPYDICWIQEIPNVLK